MAPPIPFSHKHHVGDNALDCRYCLTTVETSAFAGLPSTTICLTCHAQLFAQADVLAPLRRSAESGLPVAWNRVYTPPDLSISITASTSPKALPASSVTAASTRCR